MKSFLSLAMIFLISASAVYAQTPALVKSATTDINGDDKPDTIALSSVPNAGRFVLSVNGSKLSVSHEDFFDASPGFSVLRLNTGSKKAYIAVFLAGPNDQDENRFFTYDGKTIRPMGAAPGIVTAPGNGAVYAQWWTGLWTCHAKYAPNPSGVLRFVPQAAYYVGVNGIVKTSFPVRVAATKTAAVVANVAPGSKVTLLLFQPYGKQPGSATEGYYLIKTQTGLCGWADYKVFDGRIPDLPFAG